MFEVLVPVMVFIFVLVIVLTIFGMNKILAFRIILLVLLITLSFFIFIHYDLYLLFKDRHKLMTFIKSYPFNQLIFITLQIIQVVVSPIPGEITGFIGGSLYGPFFGTVYSTIGLTIGSWIAFMLARFFGEPLLENVVRKEVYEKFEHFMEHKGLMVSFLLFLIPGFPKDYLCYIMGVSRIPTGTFIVISTAGRIFGTILLSLTGAFAIKGQYIRLAVILFLGIAIYIPVYYYRDKIIETLKKLKKKKE
ncbi:MAG: TVP38/TMEM64 family protein [Syntrophaceae bacterium]|nr:TVP38/TMEM64 family protein [Syntrophaceae bacterium]